MFRTCFDHTKMVGDRNGDKTSDWTLRVDDSGSGEGHVRSAVSRQQCCPFPGIGPEAESSPVTLRIKNAICPGISGICPNPAAESNLG